jgi:hypothetical protein
LCRGVETTTSIVVRRVSLSVRSSVAQVDSRIRRTQRSRRGTEVYPGSGYQGPTSSGLLILIFKSTQIRGLQQSVRERFGN